MPEKETNAQQTGAAVTTEPADMSRWAAQSCRQQAAQNRRSVRLL